MLAAFALSAVRGGEDVGTFRVLGALRALRAFRTLLTLSTFRVLRA
jgi:hypothetical protein